MVRARGVEPPRGCPHMDLNHARLPFRHARIVKALFSASRYDTRLARKRKRAFGIFAKLRAPPHRLSRAKGSVACMLYFPDTQALGQNTAQTHQKRGIVPGPLILDRYRPLSTAGKGGGGTVQICWDTRIQRRVAIKCIPISQSSQENGIPGLAEARTAAMLKHPNIASVIDFETCGQEAFLIMEAIEGPSLSQVIDSAHRGELDLDIIAAVTESCAQALDFAHENAVLHLDIKPDNILIDHSGIVKITDFGISELSGADGYSQATGGTIGYMPPEQICGQDLDQRTDEFSLGVVIYEMLTGTNPYNATSIDASLRRIQAHELAPVSRARVDTPPELDQVIECTIDADPDERFETVLEMVDELEPYLGDIDEGKRKLASLLDDDQEQQEQEPVLRLRAQDMWGKVNPRARSLGARLACAALCWWTAALGFVSFGLLKTEFSMLFAVAVGAIGAIAPGIGALAALAFLGCGIIANSSLPTGLGVVVVICAAAWWYAAGRHRSAPANTTLAASALPFAWASPLAPLLAGFTLRPAQAAICSAMQATVATALGVITASGSMLHANAAFVATRMQPQPIMQAITDPALWITALSWVFAAVFVSALCSRESRVLSVVSAFAGAAVLAAGQVAAGYACTGQLAAPGFTWCASIAASAVIIVVIGALGAPYRYKEED